MKYQEITKKLLEEVLSEIDINYKSNERRFVLYCFVDENCNSKTLEEFDKAIKQEIKDYELNSMKRK